MLAAVLWVAALVALPGTVLVIYGLASLMPQPDPGVVLTVVYMALAMGAVLVAVLILTLASIGIPLAHLGGLIAGGVLVTRPGRRGRGALLLLGHGIGALVVLGLGLLLALAPVLPDADSLPELPQLGGR